METQTKYVGGFNKVGKYASEVCVCDESTMTMTILMKSLSTEVTVVSCRGLQTIFFVRQPEFHQNGKGFQTPRC